jgi:hypothetical protein
MVPGAKLSREGVPWSSLAVFQGSATLNEVLGFVEVKREVSIEAFVGEVLKVGDVPGSFFWEKLDKELSLGGFEYRATNFQYILPSWELKGGLRPHSDGLGDREDE